MKMILFRRSAVVVFAAGLEGILNKIEPPSPIDENIYFMSDNRKKELGIEQLPSSLKEALEYMKEDELIKEVLGEHIFSKFIEMKEREYKEYSIRISQWEIENYLWIF